MRELKCQSGRTSFGGRIARVPQALVAVGVLLALAPASLPLAWLRSITDAVLGNTGKPDRVDTSTRMAMDADFSRKSEPPTPEREPAQKVDQIAELLRIVREQDKEPPPRQGADVSKAPQGPLAPPLRLACAGGKQ